MNSSDRDESQVPPIDPHRGEFIDLAEETPAPAPPAAHGPDAPPAATPTEVMPLEPAEPGKYWCETENPGRHNVLGGLVEGENDFTWITTDDEKLALAALVQAGVLEKMDEAPADKDAKG